jgi:hypothetical protein
MSGEGRNGKAADLREARVLILLFPRIAPPNVESESSSPAA